MLDLGHGTEDGWVVMICTQCQMVNSISFWSSYCLYFWNLYRAAAAFSGALVMRVIQFSML